MANQVVGLRLDDEAIMRLNYLSSKYEKPKADIASVAIILLDTVIDSYGLKEILQKDSKEETK